MCQDAITEAHAPVSKTTSQAVTSSWHQCGETGGQPQQRYEGCGRSSSKATRAMRAVSRLRFTGNSSRGFEIGCDRKPAYVFNRPATSGAGACLKFPPTYQSGIDEESSLMRNQKSVRATIRSHIRWYPSQRLRRI